MAAVQLHITGECFAATIRRAQDEPVLLEEEGNPVAVVLSIAAYRELTEEAGRERSRQEQTAYEQIFGPFDDNDFVEISAQQWDDLKRGVHHFPHDPDSLARPPQVDASRAVPNPLSRAQGMS